MKKLTTLILPFLCFSMYCQAQTTKIVSGSTNFSIGSIAGTVNGTFDPPVGMFIFDPANLSTAKIELTIPTNSLFTDHKKRDKDAKNSRYMAAEEHPTIRFKSSSVSQKDGTYYAHGTMTIKGTSKEVSLPFSAIAIGDGSYTLNSQFEVDRTDYGIGGKSMMLRNVANVKMTAIVR